MGGVKLKARAGTVHNWPELDQDYNFDIIQGWDIQEEFVVFQVAYKESFLLEFTPINLT